MKAFTLFASLAVQFTICQFAVARLGDDEIQCEERYGFARKKQVAMDKSFPLITGIGTNTRTYLYQGWRIRVGFLDGIAVREAYSKVAGPGRSTTIADYESSAVLEGEKGTAAWQTKGTKFSFNITKMLKDHVGQMLAGKVWIRTDGTAMATVDSTQIRFESLAAIQHDEEVKRANEEKQRASVPKF